MKQPYDRKRQARAIAASAERRGKLKKTPCAVCGDQKVERFIEDYDKPLELVYLCKRHRIIAREHLTFLSMVRVTPPPED